MLAAFGIGVGATLTPLGEPLSTIVVIKLAREPYHADFFFLVSLLSEYVFVIIIICSILAFILLKNIKFERINITSQKDYKNAILRAIRIYIFIFSLILIGESFKPLVENYIKYFSPEVMYLFGLSSAALDNATLVAAIVSPEMSLMQIKSSLISLIIAGGLLIPGNVPNIVLAYTHKIMFREWAKIALPIGIPIFIGAFLFLFI